MKKFVTRKRRGLFALLLAFVFVFTGLAPMISNAEGAENYDIDQPVIGELTMSHNGETVSSDTKLEVSLQAEDYGVGIGYIQIQFGFIPDGSNTTDYSLVPNLYYSASDTGSTGTLTYDQASSTYRGTVSFENAAESGKFFISTVSVEDKNKNVTNMNELSSYYQGSTKYKYSVNVKPSDETESISVKSITTVRQNSADSTYTEVADRIFDNPWPSGQTNYLRIEFTSALPDVDHFVITHKYQTKNTTSQFSSTCKPSSAESNVIYAYADNYTYSYGQTMSFEITSIRAIYKDGTSKVICLGSADTSYKLICPESKSHSIKKVTITNKNGTEITQQNILNDGVVKDQDTLTFKVTLDQDNLQADNILNSTLILSTNYSSTHSTDYKYINLSFDQDTQTFTGTLTIDKKMYPTIWDVSFISLVLKDASENISFNNSGRNEFIVQNGSTTVIPQASVYAMITETHSDASFTTSYVNLNNLEAYSSIPTEKLGLPETPVSPIEGAKFVGWYVKAASGKEIPLSDYRLTSGYNSISVYPKFDKNLSFVQGTYYDQDGMLQIVNPETVELPEDVVDKESAAAYFEKLYNINDCTSLNVMYNSEFIYFNPKAKSGYNSLYFDATVPTEDELAPVQIYKFYQGELTEQFIREALDQAKAVATKMAKEWDMLGQGKLIDWTIPRNYSDTDSLIKDVLKKNGNVKISLDPKYKDGSELYCFNLKSPSEVGEAEYWYLLNPDLTVAEVENILTEDIKPDDFFNSLKFAKWKLPFSSDTKISTVSAAYDYSFIDTYAITDKQYITLDYYDDDINGYLKTEYLKANDKNQIILPDTIDGYKYVTYSYVGKDALHGGLYPAKSYGNSVIAHISNKKQPEAEETDLQVAIDPKLLTDDSTPAVDPTPTKPTEPVKPATPAAPTVPSGNTTASSINTATNATTAERALVAANPDKLVVVEATKDKDGGVKAAPAVIQQEAQKVADAVAKAEKAGGKKAKKAEVTIEMNGANIVPVEVLETAKGKNVDVTFDMGGYSWTVNGKNIGNIGLKDINLAVDQNTNAVPSNVVKALAGSNETQQISLRHDGNFGFRATLTMKAPIDEAGKYGNLYWYDSDKKLVFQDTGLVQADGTIKLDFAHASDYVIVYGKDMTPKSTSASKTGLSPKTGDTANRNNLIFLALMLALAAAFGIYGVKELREANRKRF
ncbi:MAG: hypothetical protein PUG16_07860 [Lachnospiraceae bacterium]|nr:hypothetical protein [Lachnospiraceae bacterium]